MRAQRTAAIIVEPVVDEQALLPGEVEGRMPGVQAAVERGRLSLCGFDRGDDLVVREAVAAPNVDAVVGATAPIAYSGCQG